jgi:hypothetical protein
MLDLCTIASMPDAQSFSLVTTVACTSLAGVLTGFVLEPVKHLLNSRPNKRKVRNAICGEFAKNCQAVRFEGVLISV